MNCSMNPQRVSNLLYKRGKTSELYKKLYSPRQPVWLGFFLFYYYYFFYSYLL